MKKRLIIFPIMLALLLCLAVPASAQVQYPTDPRFDGKSWDDIALDFLAEHNIAPTSTDVCFGYCNLVTGEEHYYLGEQYMDAASMYKVALNMIYADKIANGELGLDDSFYGVPFRYAQEMTIIHSDNEWAQNMWENLAGNGKTGYRNMREAMCYYMDEDIETVDPLFWENNYNNSRQIINCLKKLWAGQDTVYRNVVDCMLQAERSNYFLRNPQKVDVAQKYGYVENGAIYTNCCGICYTTEPIAIVMYTRSQFDPPAVLTDYCSLMIDYAEYKTLYDAAKAEEDAIQEAEQLAKQEQEKERLAAEARERAKAQAEQLANQSAQAGVNGENTLSTTDLPGLSMFVLGISALAFVLLLCIFLFNASKGKIRMNVAAGALSMFFVIAGMCAIFVGSRMGQLVTQYSSMPEPVTEEFFVLFDIGDYAGAKALMDNPPDIALVADPDDTIMNSLIQSLNDCFECSPAGDCIIDKTTAVRPYIITYYDLSVATVNCKGYAEEILAQVVQEAYDRTELLDENNDYLPEVLDKVFERTMERIAGESELYLTTKPVNITLKYNDGEWKIQPDSELISALRGGIR